MLAIKRFENQLMSSNCYLLWDDEMRKCIIIDPASEKSLEEIDFIESNGLTVDYIFLTHEHTDHTWGVNSLIIRYPTIKVVCSESCKNGLSEAGNSYFRFYYDNLDYTYSVKKVDITTEQTKNRIEWNGHIINFYYTPGHSMGSICININNMIFTGDTIMEFKPFINKQNGSLDIYKKTIKKIVSLFNPEWIVYPGHGNSFLMKEFVSSF